MLLVVVMSAAVLAASEPLAAGGVGMPAPASITVHDTRSPEGRTLQGSAVAGQILLGLRPRGADVRRARYVVDGPGGRMTSAVATGSPFTATLDTSRLEAGAHRVTAELDTDAGPRSVSASFDVPSQQAQQVTAPVTVSDDVPQPYPARVAAIYHTLFPNPTAPRLSDLPANVNVVNLAFAEGNPPRLIGGAPPVADLARDVRDLRARGVRVMLSIGGADGEVDLRDRDSFVRGILAISDIVPLDGIDWDIERSAVSGADVEAISRALKDRRGPTFAITMAPNGSTIDQVLPIAVALNSAGDLDMIGQQFYDAPVSVEAAAGRIRQIRDAGIPESKIGIGMMIGGGDNYWTLEQCVENVSALYGEFPDLRGGYLWESGRPGTGEWAAQVAPVLSRGADVGWSR